MRFGIFSDVHSNLEALQAVIKSYEDERIDKYIFLGDVVGYGANPNECCNLIKNMTNYAILGNHDAACCDKLNYSWFNPLAQDAINWNKKQISKENLQWIDSLDYTLHIKDHFFTSHGLPLNPDAFEYDDNINKIKLYFNKSGKRFPLCFMGHTHRPIVFVKQKDNENNILVNKRKRIYINPDNKYLINVGSVGQPRDGNPMSCYTIFDSKTRTVTFCRVKYDVKKTVDKIRKAHLPQMLAERLLIGY